MNKNYAKLFFAWLVFFPVVAYFLGVWIPFYGDEMLTKAKDSFCEGDLHNHWGFLHWFYFIICLAAYIIVGVHFYKGAFEDTYEPDINLTPKGIPVKRIVKWVIGLLIIFGIWNVGIRFYERGKFIYNTSTVYKNNLQQAEVARQGFYDKMWKTYMTKSDVTRLNKDAFIEVTRIVMEGRSDGQSVAWKWVQENQQIPYEQFTDFYRDLSAFIETQREGYYALEKQCQDIVRQQNTLLDTFPHNMYNHVLGIKRLTTKYGFLSDSTNKVFSTGVENVQTQQ